jgi:hypothetical protein
MAISINKVKRAPMERVVNAILERHGLIKTFDRSAEFHLQLEHLPYLPLVIERHRNEVAVMHYFIQQGDVMMDPELTFSLPAWSPTSITQHPVGVYRQVYVMVNGRQMMNPRLLRELEAFARTWAQNLRAQGFITGEPVVATSLTHPELLMARVAT